MGITKFKRVGLFMVLILYLILRLPLLTVMNEYWDYDEGTYLLIGKLITQGYLPYRDIFAVHPPGYYYLLALWMKIFGFSYIVGRSLSLFLGGISVIIAYFIGKEIKDEKLGFVLALIIALDPMLLHVNTLAMIENGFEPVVLASIYYFAKFLKSEKDKYANYSLLLAGFATTIKFTAAPFAAGLFLTILSYRIQELWGYIKGALIVIFNKRQVFIILSTFTVMTIIITLIISLFPSDLNRKLFVVPILHKIPLVGTVISVAIFLLIWGFLTLYAYDVSYVSKLIRSVILIISNFKTVLTLAFWILLPKLFIEGALGVLISTKYLSQTYGVQGNRYPPILNFFDFLSDKMEAIKVNEPEFLLFDLLIIIVLAILFFKFTMNKESERDRMFSGFAFLFVASLGIYAMIPTIMNTRFLIPTLLTFYVPSAYYISKLNFTRKQFISIFVLSVLVLSLADVSLVFIQPNGKLKLASTPHAKDLRDSLKDYLMENHLNGVIYGVSPMENFYLGLDTVPYYVDNFGLILAGMNSSELLEKIKENGANYVIVNTWVYAFTSENKLRGQYLKLVENLRANYSLVYGDSYDRGEVKELYFIGKPSFQTLTFRSGWGKLELLNGDFKLINVYPWRKNEEFDKRCRVYLNGNNYTLEFYSNTSKITLTLIKTAKSIKIVGVKGLTLKIEPEKVSKIVAINGKILPLTKLKKENAAKIRMFSLNGKTLEIYGNFTVYGKDEELVLEVNSDEVKFVFNN